MGIGSSHEPKEDERKGFPSKHIFSPVGSPPPLDFFPSTNNKSNQNGQKDNSTASCQKSQLLISEKCVYDSWNIHTEPVVFRWHHKGRDKIPKEIYLHGQWDDDHPIKMIPDTEPPNASAPERAPRSGAPVEEETVFITIVNLPPGTHYYNFTVDGRVCLAPDQPIVNSRNSVTVLPSEAYSQAASNQDEEGWGQEIPDLSDPPVLASPQKPQKKKQGPVELPAHLERALLNSQPISGDPSMLPLPHHVMLNHLYSRPSLHNTYILGLTIRHRENFVTVVFYKPTEPADEESHPIAPAVTQSTPQQIHF